jgi:hypothetical protein
MRDMSFIEEILKTKAILKVLQDKLEKGDADVDIVEYSLATKILEAKLSVLNSLNIDVGEGKEDITLNVNGSGKSLIINLAKLKEAITVQEVKVDEKQGVAAKKEDLLEGINMDTITEDEFLDKAVERIGPIQKTKNKTLTKESFVKIFKFTGEFAKLRSKDIKKAG